MIQLVSCPRCKGFLALALRACPHCQAPIDRARQLMLGIAGIAGGGAVSMTLMACYGMPCVNDGTCVVTTPDIPTDASTDASNSDAGRHDGGDAGVQDGGDSAVDGSVLDGAVDGDAVDGDALDSAVDGGALDAASEAGAAD